MSCTTFMAIAITAHFNSPAAWNDFHPMLEAECRQELTSGAETAVSVGTYYNSVGNWSNYVTLEYKWPSDWFVEGGIVSGYRGGKLTPYARVGYDVDDYTRLFAAPTANGDFTRIGVVIGVEKKF